MRIISIILYRILNNYTITYNSPKNFRQINITSHSTEIKKFINLVFKLFDY